MLKMFLQVYEQVVNKQQALQEHSCVFVPVICYVRYSAGYATMQLFCTFLGDGPHCLSINYGVCSSTP